MEKGKLGHLLKPCVNPFRKHMHINSEREKTQKPRNRKSQRTKTTPKGEETKSHKSHTP